MAPVEPLQFYQRELARVTGERASLQAWFDRLAALRLAIFLAGLVAAIGFVLTRSQWLLLGIGLAILAFVALAIVHGRVIAQREIADRSIGHWRRGIGRLTDRWLDGGDPGDRFLNEGHLYAADLAIFGRGSLFHYLSTAVTQTGAATLARWLSEPATPPVIAERQAAVRDLATRHQLRHDLAIAAGDRSALDSPALRTWLAEPEVPASRGLLALVEASALANVIATIGTLTGTFPGIVLLVAIIWSTTLTLGLKRRFGTVISRAGRPARDLEVVARLINRAERESYRAALLVRIFGKDAAAGAPDALVASLSRYSGLADARANQLFAPIAGLLLVGTQIAIRIERWRQRNRERVERWLTAAGELEALASFATSSFEHPSDTFPTVHDRGAGLVAERLGHPLIPEDRVVRNDLTLGNPRLLLISGSNMSGKSTLLKAVGLNAVLAFAGAPVRAAGLTIGVCRVGASLVLRESLLEGRSRFFAEILRLKEIVALLDRGMPVLFLLDELLSGTNSHDRAIGARGVLRGLIARGAIGIVTTHDLALAALADELGGAAENWHFDDTFAGGHLSFDYLLKPGVVTRSNALELMKEVGLDVS